MRNSQIFSATCISGRMLFQKISTTPKMLYFQSLSRWHCLTEGPEAHTLCHILFDMHKLLERAGFANIVFVSCFLIQKIALDHYFSHNIITSWGEMFQWYLSMNLQHHQLVTRVVFTWSDKVLSICTQEQIVSSHQFF